MDPEREDLWTGIYALCTALHSPRSPALLADAEPLTDVERAGALREVEKADYVLRRALAHIGTPDLLETWGLEPEEPTE